MFDRVLSAYDGSPASRAGLEFSLELAREFGSRVSVAHVIEPGRTTSEQGVGDQAPLDPGAARDWLSDLCERSSLPGFPPLTPVTLEGGRPARALLELAGRERLDLIVAGKTGGHGVAGFLFGSVAERIVRGAPCSVAVVPAESSAATPPCVLAGYDGSERSAEALRVASVLAASFPAGLRVVHAVDYRVPFMGHPPESARKLIREQGERVLKEGRAVISAPLDSLETELREGDPRSALLEAARSHRPRFLVLGHRGAGGFPGLGLGSAAEAIVRMADCPVLVVKPPGAGDGGEGG
jgi:nucleotide-binding universal stress UspA family protein